jgi:magnesium chelatase family protein
LCAAISKLNLSARAYSRILKVARTIADLDGGDFISLSHLSEALLYRGFDRKNWNE